jgi:hypothetical protein
MAKAALTPENLISCLTTGKFENLKLYKDLTPIIECLQKNEHKFTATSIEFSNFVFCPGHSQFLEFMGALGQNIKNSGVTIKAVTVSGSDTWSLTKEFGLGIGHCRAKVLVIKNCDNATDFLLGYCKTMRLSPQRVILVDSNVSQDFVDVYGKEKLNITEVFTDPPILKEPDHHQGAAAVATEEVLGAPGGPAFVFDDAAEEVLGASSKAACASGNSLEN